MSLEKVAFRKQSRSWHNRLLVLVVVLLFSVVSFASAQEPVEPTPAAPVTDDRVNAIAEQLYCPVCENVPLDVCGTQACADWRDEIRTMLEQGKSEADIKGYFAERYGQRVLATPEARGLNMLVWALPVIGALAAIIILVVTLRRLAPGALDAQSPPEIEPDYSGIDQEYVSRLERELKEFSG
ncbi:MAG: cytochrome c-type biogenesis protein CcmH [Anaerolineae bacterium]|nr:cytochrome c-type biogenesis protein CcmH [Anaerolineae bacterium]